MPCPAPFAFFVGEEREKALKGVGCKARKGEKTNKKTTKKPRGAATWTKKRVIPGEKGCAGPRRSYAGQRRAPLPQPRLRSLLRLCGTGPGCSASSHLLSLSFLFFFPPFLFSPLSP